MSLSFILVRPARAANVGAAARALKTQGFGELIVVDSQAHTEEEAQWVACGAEDILSNVRTADSLAALRDEFDLLVATTARDRSSPHTFHSPDELAQLLADKPQSRVAIVFGCEASGLSNTDLALCDLYSYVSLAGEYPSLNLAQAVMVYSYELGMKRSDQRIGLQQQAADEQQTQALKQRVLQTMAQLGNQQDDKLKQWLLDGVAQLGERDIKMAHQLVGDILKHTSKN